MIFGIFSPLEGPMDHCETVEGKPKLNQGKGNFQFCLVSVGYKCKRSFRISTQSVFEEKGGTDFHFVLVVALSLKMSDRLTNTGMKRLIKKINTCTKLIARTGKDPIELKLPKIAVIGPTSAGKTSVLEVSFKGCHFLESKKRSLTNCYIFETKFSSLQADSHTNVNESIYLSKDY